MDFFMKSEQYHGFELPEYFTFDKVLMSLCDVVRTTLYEKYLIEVIFFLVSLCKQLNSTCDKFWSKYYISTRQKGRLSPYKISFVAKGR